MIRRRFIYLAALFLCMLLVFSGFRLVLFLQHRSAFPGVPADLFADAFSLGADFDTMAASYLLLPAFLLLAGATAAGSNARWIRRALTAYCTLALCLVLLASAADLPWYAFSGSRLNTSIALWTDTPGTMLRFAATSAAYRPYLFVFLGGVTLSVVFLFFLQGKVLARAGSRPGVAARTLFCAGCAALLLIGVRGGMRLRPVSMKDAFTSNHVFANLLPLNPLYTFFESMDEFTPAPVAGEDALRNVRQWLGADTGLASPAARRVEGSGSGRRPNIVLVMMESMSAAVTGYLGGRKGVTPTLDSLAANGLSFTRFYTCGAHTFNGIYGTLYGMPSFRRRHALSNMHAINQDFYGMPAVLREHDYRTAFFCTHHEEFDNMGFFLRKNGFQEFFGDRDHAPEIPRGPFGVPDEALYDLALGKINALAGEGVPFFAALLTISAHEPPELPRGTAFRPHSSDAGEAVYEYADWALGEFIRRCAAQPWYDSTLFVILADHGSNSPSPYDIPLSWHHSPLVIFGPALAGAQAARSVDGPALQTDVFPTLMGLTGLPYINNTMGVDLLRETRPFAFFCKDDLVGCVDRDHLLVMRKFGGDVLYHYASGGTENLIGERAALADSMRNYTFSFLHAAQWMLENKMMGKP